MQLGTVDATNEAARALAKKYAGLGLPCEVEAGPLGLMIYAASEKAVRTIAASIIESVKALEPKARTFGVPTWDPEEDDATAWWVEVRIDWKRMGG